MVLKDRVKALEQKTQKLEQLYKCSQGQHDLCFYDLGESSMPKDYYIRHVCRGCKKIFQRPPNDAEIKLLKIERSKSANATHPTRQEKQEA